jgi:UTP--glucose-1-phosphate uridylyltransferase
MARVRKAVLPVAGLGTRVLPATKSTPKELLNVVDRPIISYIVAEARAAGIEHFVFVTGRGKDAIENYFDHQIELEAQLEAKAKTEVLDQILAELPKAGEMSFVRQMAPLGLGHAVWCARDVIGDEPFAVLLPDVIVDAETPCLAQLVQAFDRTGANILAVEAVPDSECHKYGIVTPAGGRDGRLLEIAGMVEKPRPGTAPSNLCIAGRYILRPEIFQALSMHEQPFYAYEYEGVTHDCGDKIGLLRANVALALKRPDLGEAARAALRPLLEKV